MKVIDNNGKLFGKINLLDFIIVLVLAVLLIGGIYKLAFVDNTIYVPEYQEGYVTVKLLSLREYEANAIAVGDTVSVPKIQMLGEVVELERNHRVDSVGGADGDIYPVENPIYYEITVKIKSDQLLERDGHYYVGKNFKLISGQSLDLTNGFLNCKATVNTIEISK